MADVHVLRHLVHAQGRSQRSVAKELGISRNTVVRYLDDAVEAGVRVEAEARPKPVYEMIEATVFELMKTSRTTKKQRLTSPTMKRLLAKQGLEASSRTIRRAMAEYRRRAKEAHIPLEYHPGDLAEVDFFEVRVVIDGVEQKAWMFVMRLMYSGRDFAWLYKWQDQACFLDGHVRAFEHFGFVPKRILYDNLKAAVRKHLAGSQRELTVRFQALVAHYAFDARFARPREGHDKGGVESRGKAIRWQHLTPLQEADTLDEVSRELLSGLDASMDRPRRRGDRSIRALWAEEIAEMLMLPSIPFDPGILFDVGVDRSSKVRVKTAWYSVPCEWKLLPVHAWLYADRVVIAHAGRRVTHPRQPGNGKSIWYPHYLSELAKKPQAIEQVAETLMGQLGLAYERAWKILVVERGRRAAARSFKIVLRLADERGIESVGRALERAMDADDDVVLALRGPVPKATTMVPVALAHVRVESSSLTVYDGLSGGPR